MDGRVSDAMPRPLPLLATALLLLLPLPALAGDLPSDRPVRHIRLHLNRPDAGPHQEVHLYGGVTTIITTPWAIRARGTGLAGRGARPFEVLLGSRRVIITPKRALAPAEKFPFILRLVDDTVIPLVLAAPAAGQRPDAEVALDFDDEAAELRVQLASMTDKAQGLESRLKQALQEQDSADFALAQLLAAGQAPLTTLEEVHERQLVTDERGRIDLATYAASSKRHGPRKVVAIVLTVTNTGKEPMAVRLQDLYNRTTLERIPAAVRAQPAQIAPGARGRVSMVVDSASLGADGEPMSLDLQVQRGEVRTELPVDLFSGDFEG